MKRIVLKTLILVIALLGVRFAHGQSGGSVGVGTKNPDKSAILEIYAPNKGVLLPRIGLQSVTDVTSVPTPAHGLLIFNTNSNITGGSGQGFYYWNSSVGKWLSMATGTTPVSGAQIFVSSTPLGSSVGKEGDIYIHTSTGNLYQKDSNNNWVLQGSLKGPGVGVLDGSGVPPAKGEIGYPGSGINIYRDTLTNIMYVQNANGTWTVISGKDGIVGIAEGNTPPAAKGEPGYLGAKINIYTDTIANIVYVQKTAGTWTPINANITAGNGLTAVGRDIQLGGALTKSTVIATGGTANTLAITGLQDGNAATDSFLVIESGTGIIKKIPATEGIKGVLKSVIRTTTNGEMTFLTPLPVTDMRKISVYRNGINLEFTKTDNDHITLELDTESPTTYLGDEIKIYQQF